MKDECERRRGQQWEGCWLKNHNRTLARKRQTERENAEDDGTRLHSNGMKGHLWKIESECRNPREGY